MSLPDGLHGYHGVVLWDSERDMVQCHICGAWFKSLQTHVRNGHGVEFANFRTLVGLSKSTEVSSFSTRERLAQTCRAWIENHPEEWQQRINKMLAAPRVFPELKDSMTSRNRMGTCHAQAIERLRTLANSLGRTPKKNEVPGGLRELLVKRFGRYHHAVVLAGLKPNTKEYELSGKYKKKDVVK